MAELPTTEVYLKAGGRTKQFHPRDVNAKPTCKVSLYFFTYSAFCFIHSPLYLLPSHHHKREWDTVFPHIPPHPPTARHPRTSTDTLLPRIRLPDRNRFFNRYFNHIMDHICSQEIMAPFWPQVFLKHPFWNYP